ncbi:MAG: WG repeat-containing protein, partial [Gammaproteobacteria bacterium]
MTRTYQRLYPVHFGNRTGYIDQHGDILISPKPFLGHDFHEGLAVVKVPDHGEFGFGFINEAGRMAIRARFLWADSFHEGFARVELKRDLFSFVNPQGQLTPGNFT